MVDAVHHHCGPMWSTLTYSDHAGAHVSCRPAARTAPRDTDSKDRSNTWGGGHTLACLNLRQDRRDRKKCPADQKAPWSLSRYRPVYYSVFTVYNKKNIQCPNECMSYADRGGQITELLRLLVYLCIITQQRERKTKPHATKTTATG